MSPQSPTLRPSPRLRALDILLEPDPATKARLARALFDELPPEDPMGAGVPVMSDGDRGAQLTLSEAQQAAMPGRPALPRLVPAKEVPSRSPFTLEGRAALLHAICHIEFNAINLALDAVWRFADMPEAFYRDWLRVAAEEALHFTLLREHLQGLGHDYGDFDAHDGLWSMAEKTKDDIVARMALVPRTLEARGLDATPPLQAKLRKAGDLRAVEILVVILRDEIGHVAIGNRWYAWLCRRDGLEPISTYADLTLKYQAPRLRAPFNLSAREAAGFTAEELSRL